MPIYLYECPACQARFDVVKSVAQINDSERCGCGSEAERKISRVNFTNAGDWHPTYNPALGQVVRSKAHLRSILADHKARTGTEMIEVGNEPVENIHKRADRHRAEAREKTWSESAEKILHEVRNGNLE